MPTTSHAHAKGMEGAFEAKRKPAEDHLATFLCIVLSGAYLDLPFKIADARAVSLKPLSEIRGAATSW